MKEFYSRVNRKFYYISMLVLIVLMVSGLVTSWPYVMFPDAGFMLQFILVALLSACLLFYPRHETHVFRIILTLLFSAYFYTLFFLYPETWSTFILICFIPAIAILYFDSKLFYLSFVLNGVLIVLMTSLIFSFNKGDSYQYLKEDPIGNIFDLAGIQVLLFLIHYVSSKRIKKLHHYYEQLQHAERLKLTGQLTAAVAHEIRNPLTVVKGFLQYYHEDASIHPSMKSNLTLMIDELDTAEQVISQFLTLTKPVKELTLEKVNVKESLQSVASLLHSYGTLHDNQIHINAEEDCFIAINRIEFKQVLVNLIKNAMEASGMGKSISVQAGRNGNLVEIKIIDEGSGMSEEEVKSLGTPFYSLKSKGTGLGLMICFNIVEKYDGEIHFNSLVGKGTTVTLQFLAVCG